MSGVTVRGKLRPRRQPPEPQKRAERPAQPAVTPPKRPPVSRAARQLALAHHIERLVDAGELADYAEAARLLGLTRARVTQVMNLLLLAPEVQERVLCGDEPVSERHLRDAVGEPVWDAQAIAAAP